MRPISHHPEAGLAAGHLCYSHDRKLSKRHTEMNSELRLGFTALRHFPPKKEEKSHLPMVYSANTHRSTPGSRVEPNGLELGFPVNLEHAPLP